MTAAVGSGLAGPNPLALAGGRVHNTAAAGLGGFNGVVL